MKIQASQDVLWQTIRWEDIDTVATFPLQQAEKDCGLADFRKILNGCSRVEVMHPCILSQANQGVISFSRAVQLCASNPARIFGCQRKGSLAVDIVIYHSNQDVTIS